MPSLRLDKYRPISIKRTLIVVHVAEIFLQRIHFAYVVALTRQHQPLTNTIIIISCI